MQLIKELKILKRNTVSDMFKDNEHNISFARAQASQQIYNPDAFTLKEVEEKFNKVYELPEWSPTRDYVPWFHYAAMDFLHVVIHKRMQDLKKKYCE
jgi:hypothetical protein